MSIKKRNILYRGFTLVELLAVLVILAAIMLIIIPMVDNAIDKAEESSNIKSAEFYIKAVELGIKADSFDNIKVPDGSYDLMKNGNVCIGTYDKSSNTCVGHELQVEITSAPKAGFVTIENNLVIEYSITLNNDKIVSKDRSCFEYVDNYDYTINEEVCINEFVPLLVEKLGGSDSNDEETNGEEVSDEETNDEEVNIEDVIEEQLTDINSLVCNKKALDYFGLDLIYIADFIDYSPTKLESEGIISIEKSSKKGNGTVSITKYTCAEEEKNVKIPRMLNNKPVTGIGPLAFSQLNDLLPKLKQEDIEPLEVLSDIEENEEDEEDEILSEEKMINSITIPNSVTTIGAGAFAGNKLNTIIIPNSVTAIGAGAFVGNQLTSVAIPNGVTSTGIAAFALNQLKSITIPNTVTTIGDLSFIGNQLTSVTIPTSVTTIGGSAFSSNQLTSVTIPTSVTTIGDSAFSSNQLTSVTIPTSVTTIGDSAFSSNQLTSVTIPNGVTTIGYRAFARNNLTSVTIPNSVTTIETEAFYNNEIKNAIIGSGINYIGGHAIGWNYTLFIGYKSYLEDVYINRSPGDVTMESSAFGWAAEHSAENNLHWNSTGPTG